MLRLERAAGGWPLASVSGLDGQEKTPSHARLSRNAGDAPMNSNERTYESKILDKIFARQVVPQLPIALAALPDTSSPKSGSGFPNLHPCHLKPVEPDSITVTNFISEPR